VRTVARLAATGVFVVLTACDVERPVVIDQRSDSSLRQTTTAKTSNTQPTSASVPSSVAAPGSSDGTMTTPSPPTVFAAASPPRLSTSAPAEATDPRMYRPDPIRARDRTAATGHPDITRRRRLERDLSFVEFPDGRFLQVDLIAVTVPTGAEFWTIAVNGRLKMKTFATASSTMGARLDRDVYGNTVIVLFNAVAADGNIISTTGDIEVTDGG
jgi:hypothetical protein